MEQLQPLIDLLGGDKGQLAQVVTWWLALQMGAKPVSAFLQSGMAKLLAFVAITPEEDDDALVVRILNSKTYRAIAFLVDWTTRVKLPLTGDYIVQGQKLTTLNQG